MSVGANRRADQINRRIFTGVALLLLAIGVAAWLAGLGAFTDRSSDVILSASARATIDDWIWLGWLAAALVAVGVLLLSVRWLVFELRPIGPARDLVLDLDDELHLRVSSDAWLDAVLEDVLTVEGVADAGARLDIDDRLTVHLVISVREVTLVGAIAEDLDGWVRKRAQHTIERPVELDVEVDLVDVPATVTQRVA